jgi:hypothetical protein
MAVIDHGATPMHGPVGVARGRRLDAVAVLLPLLAGADVVVQLVVVVAVMVMVVVVVDRADDGGGGSVVADAGVFVLWDFWLRDARVGGDDEEGLRFDEAGARVGALLVVRVVVEDRVGDGLVIVVDAGVSPKFVARLLNLESGKLKDLLVSL